MHRILVTGAAGFIGFYLSKLLLSRGLEVVGIDNLNDYYDVQLKNQRLAVLSDFDRFKFYNIDLVDAKGVKGVFEAHGSFEVVVNLAAQAGVRYSLSHPEKYVESNLIGFSNVLEVCRCFNVGHLVYASSSSVYGNSPVPFSEEDACNEPLSFYAATKKANEAMAYSYSHLFALPTTGLRFFTVYGPWGRPDMAYFSFTQRIFDGQPIKVFNNGDLMRDFTYIDDIVGAIDTLVAKGPGTSPLARIFNIGNNSPVKLLDFISVLEKEIGIEAVKEYYPMQDGDVYSTYANIDKLYNEIGFKPSTTIEVGLKKFVDWYRNYYRK